MTVYNGEPFIRETMDSILSQSFSDFEFIIVVDPSTDNTLNILKTYQDKRIKLIINDQKMGLIKSRNLSLEYAKGDYVAIIDGDDIAYPSRLQKQFDFMENHPEFGLVGCRAEFIDDVGKTKGIAWRYGLLPEDIPPLLLFGNYFVHSSIFIRKSFLPPQGYEYETLEDYDLVVNISKQSKVWSLPDILIKYRVHNQSRTYEHTVISDDCKENYDKIFRCQLKSLDIDPTIDELEIHRQIVLSKEVHGFIEIESLRNWLIKLLLANIKREKYSKIKFEKLIIEKWLMSCYKARKLGIIKILVKYFSIELPKFDLLKYMIRYIPYYLRYRANRGIGVL